MQFDELHKNSQGEGVVIALIDSGVSEFQIAQPNVAERRSSDYDVNGHGTMMCSLIVGYEHMFEGIAPRATVYSYKVADRDGKVSGDGLREAVTQATDDGVDIINISLGSYKEDDRVREAVNQAVSEGIVVVASAGDYESGDMLFPARMDAVISVGAVDEVLQPWPYTNAPDQCSILAPGVDVTTVDNARRVGQTSGTSQSSALIAGYLALLNSASNERGVAFNSLEASEALSRINAGVSTYSSELERLAKQ